MKYCKDYLLEHILSIGLKDSHDKYREQYMEQFIKILQNSYKNVEGGYSGLGSGTVAERSAIKDDLNLNLIKATVRDGKITTLTVYKDKNGRKIIACGTDDTPQGKADFMRLKTEDHTMARAWAEASGAVENLLKKIGMPTVPSSLAAKLTGKEILRHDVNGTHYDRKIGNDVHTKTILGHPKLD